MQKHRPDRLTAPDEPALTARATASAGGPNRYNLAARAARWSATHWKTAVAVWVAFVAVAIGVGRPSAQDVVGRGAQRDRRDGAGGADPRRSGFRDAGGGERARPLLDAHHQGCGLSLDVSA